MQPAQLLALLLAANDIAAVANVASLYNHKLALLPLPRKKTPTVVHFLMQTGKLLVFSSSAKAKP